MVDTDLVKEQNQYLARNNHITDSRKIVPDESRAFHCTVRRQIAMNIPASREQTHEG
jgi:hypothetical protein